jgi:hypothetical protein
MFPGGMVGRRSLQDRTCPWVSRVGMPRFRSRFSTVVGSTHRCFPTLWGLNIQFGLDQRVFGCSVGSCCDLVLAGESVEDWSAVDLVVDEVDHVWGLGRGLGRCALPERSVWPRLVEMVQVCGEDLP